MISDDVTRGPGTGSRAGVSAQVRAGAAVSRRRRCTVEMIGVKWSPERHGNLRARLREAVAADGAEGYADWLTRQLDARDAEVSRARRGPHPLAV